jgi:hypothetical protein
MDPLLARIAKVLPPGHIRLRSSTNAEDLAGFNGAGLYRSVRVDPADPKDVERGLKQVWASVWSYGAFEERRFYRITFEDGRGFERLSASSLAGGKPVLADADVEALVKALTMIHILFTGDAAGTSGKAVDVEDLVVGPKRRIVIVQARPYTVTWSGDCRWLDADGEPVP